MKFDNTSKGTVNVEYIKCKICGEHFFPASLNDVIKHMHSDEGLTVLDKNPKSKKIK